MEDRIWHRTAPSGPKLVKGLGRARAKIKEKVRVEKIPKEKGKHHPRMAAKARTSQLVRTVAKWAIQLNTVGTRR